MSSANRLRDNVERWLIHENYKFSNKKNEDYSFCIVLKNVGSYGTPIEIFEPKKQPGVLVIGGKTFFKNNQTLRYNKLTYSEREKFHSSVKDYCDSIFAINKIFKEDGKVVIEVFVVLDKVEQFTQELVIDTINKIIEMSEKVNRFVLKTF
jgi:hypothetical protein